MKAPHAYIHYAWGLETKPLEQTTVWDLVPIEMSPGDVHSVIKQLMAACTTGVKMFQCEMLKSTTVKNKLVMFVRSASFVVLSTTYYTY